MSEHQRPEGRYARRFKQLSQAGQKAFIPFTLLGWPDMETSYKSIRLMIEAGVSALELGFPFSDPVADGPVIQEASQEAIDAGFRVDDGFALLKQARAMDNDIPIGLLVYYNIVIARGLEAFFADAQASGVDAVLIADLPPESASEIIEIAHTHQIELIFIVSPLTSESRLAGIQEMAGGFVYVVSRLGITGVDNRTDESLGQLIRLLKTLIKLPVCVGFGVSTPEQAEKMLMLGADGVITGSRIVQIIRESQGGNLAETLLPFLQSMVAVAHAPTPVLGENR
jgi:tryptophan synthase alpha chain